MNKKDLSIVILAAGKGSRMKSNKAKVLHNISGKPMLYHIIKTAQEISDDITVVVAHQKEEVIKELSKFFKNINFVTQDAQNFPGTGGAMMDVKPKRDKVLVLNGDMPLISADALSGFLSSDAKIIMSIFELQNPDGYGRVIIENSEVLRIVEHKDANEQELKVQSVNAGIYAFSSSVLKKYIPLLKNDNAQKEYYLTDIISLAKADAISISPLLVDEEHFRGVNSKEDLAECEVIMQDKIKSYWMREGVVMQLPHTIYIEESVKFEGECIVENNCRITGDTLISNSHIKSSSVIEDSRIIDSDVGPLAHIRPMSELKNTHIGNFVEVKKSTLIGVKAGHLSYIGDAEVGEGTNVGAGVITCNYDGKKKYKTIIGKNVFIGSDSQLIAPLEVEDDVMIAAGTTVSGLKVQSGVLAISRPELRIIKDFYYKFFFKK